MKVLFIWAMTRLCCDTIWHTGLGGQVPFCRGKHSGESSPDCLFSECGQYALWSTVSGQPWVTLCLLDAPVGHGALPTPPHCRCCSRHLRASCHLSCGLARSSQATVLGSSRLFLYLYTQVALFKFLDLQRVCNGD